MDLVAAMLHQSLVKEHRGEIEPLMLRPAMPRQFERLPLLGDSGAARNADRVIGRFIHYPRWLKGRRERPDVFHLVDHSYAHLLHSLPAERTVVTCHDLDTFRSVLEPEREPRGPVFRAMTRYILGGLRRAARVACDSNATRDGILAYDLLPPERLQVVYLGVDPVMSPSPDPQVDSEVETLLGRSDGTTVDLLHVGSTIPRKRIDVLLRTFAAVRSEIPEARLVRIGGEFTSEQQELIRTLGIDPAAIVVVPYMPQRRLAAVYRRAALVLQPSSAEGFGLPVAEAMACGVPVVASDLAVLREVGGTAGAYCTVADVPAWSGTVCAMLRERRDHPDRWAGRQTAALQQASQFTWSRFTDRMVSLYHDVSRTATG